MIDARAQASEHRWLAFGVVLTAAFMDLVDGTMISVALPRIQADLGAAPSVAQWTLAGYLLALALGLIPGGRLGDRYGRKRVFLVGIAAFTVASAACGAAVTGELLVVARLVQGLSAAMMVPQAISVVVVLFTHHERPKAFALYGAVLSLANVSGPILGGIFMEYSVLSLGWRAIFYVNVPVGVLAFLAAVRYLPESKSDQRIRMDLAGIAVISLASLTLMLPLVQGREAGWPAWMLVLMATSVPLLLVFGAIERRQDRIDRSALVPPDLLTRRSFVVGLIVLLAVYSGLASLFVIVYFTLQLGLGWAPLTTALAGIGFPIGIAVTTGVAQRFASSHGRRVIRAGLSTMIVAAIGLIAVIEVAGASIEFGHIAVPILVMGLGMGLCISILTSVVVADVPDDSAGAGSGVTNAVLQLGAAVGIAIVGTVYFSRTSAAATGQASDAAAHIYLDAATTTIWYQPAVFLLALLLTPFLPRAASVRQTGPDE